MAYGDRREKEFDLRGRISIWPYEPRGRGGPRDPEFTGTYTDDRGVEWSVALWPMKSGRGFSGTIKTKETRQDDRRDNRRDDRRPSYRTRQDDRQEDRREDRRDNRSPSNDRYNDPPAYDDPPPRSQDDYGERDPFV